MRSLLKKLAKTLLPLWWEKKNFTLGLRWGELFCLWWKLSIMMVVTTLLATVAMMHEKYTPNITWPGLHWTFHPRARLFLWYLRLWKFKKNSSFYIANEGPVKILYKCLVPIYVFLEMSLFFPKPNYNVLCLPFPTLINRWDIYIFPGSVCLFGCREICGPILGIYTVNSSQTHESGKWDWGRAIPRKGMHKWEFLYSVL